jgi:tRNA(Ile)-lysidine synthase
MQILRGSGRIRGILPVKQKIIRPLINVPREMILDYCTKHGLEFRQDSTNSSAEYTRNKIRREIIPMLEREFNPNLTETLTRLAEVSQAEDEYLEQAAAKSLNTCLENNTINIKTFNQLDPAIKRRALRLLLIGFYGNSLENITFGHIEAIINLTEKQSGKEVILPKGVIAKRAYNSLILGYAQTTPKLDVKLPFEQEVYIEEIKKWLYLGRTPIKPKNPKNKNVFTKALDFGKICDNMDIRIRNRRPGDTIYFKGMGTKKLKDYFIDKKVPKELRDQTILIAQGKDIIKILNGPCSDKFNPKQETDDCIYLQIF